MKKSFKKVIACLLAVLMVAFSMPFSALAAPGDYEPDIQLQFSTFGDGENFGEKEFGPGKAAAIKATWSSSVLNSAPVTYDASTGTLTVTKADMDIMNAVHELDPAEGDWTLSTGDAFAVTVRIDNVDEVAAGNINIRYSDNIAPAGFVTTGKGTSTQGLICTENEMPDGASVEAGFKDPLADFSASTLYDGINDELPDASAIIEDKYAQADDGWSDDMMNANIVCKGDSVDVSKLEDSPFPFNIENHTYDEENLYDYAGKFIVVTFAFMITGDGPVRFALQDPDGSLDPLLDGAAYFAKKTEGQKTEDATTYATNTFDRKTMQQGGETEWPGSRKMTFMGQNENNLTITFKDVNGDVISSDTYGKGTVVVPPALPETVKGDETHTIYSWDTEPAEIAEANATYQVVATTEEHNFVDPQVTKHATCTEKGEVVSTCACGKTKTEEIDMIPHTAGEAVRKNEVAPTCSQEGSYDLVVSCTVCKTVLATEHHTIDKLPHTPKAAVKEKEVPATCTEDGSYDEVVYCSVCDEEVSRETKTIEKLGHAYTAVVTAPTCTEQGYTTYTCSRCQNSYVGDYVAAKGHTEITEQENVKPATCTEDGSYDEVVKCSVCGEEFSRTPKTIPATGHNYVETVTAPTCTAKGYTTHTCSKCGDTFKSDEKAALGHKWDSGKITKTTATTYTTTYTCTRCKATKKETANKKANTLKVTTKKINLKASAVKKGNQTITKAKAFTVSDAKGSVTFKKSSGNSKITVTSAGKITVKKGLKKGTYKVKVAVTAAGNNTYKKGTKTVTVTIVIK